MRRKFYRRAGCRLTTFVLSRLLQDCTSQRPRGVGCETITASFFRGHASRSHVYCSSSHIFHSPSIPQNPPPPLGPNRFWSDPKIHSLGKTGRWLNAACSHKQKHTHIHKSVCLSQLSLLILSLLRAQFLCPTYKLVYNSTRPQVCISVSSSILLLLLLLLLIHIIDCSYPFTTHTIKHNVIPCPVIQCDGRKRGQTAASRSAWLWLRSLQQEVSAKMRARAERLSSRDAHQLFCLSVAWWKAFSPNPLEERRAWEGSV